VMTTKKTTSLYGRIREILEAARTRVTRTVNTTQVVANWLIGREIVEEEQGGHRQATYGDALLEHLAAKLTADFGVGYSGANLRWFRQFYLEYGGLLPKKICHAVRDKSISARRTGDATIHHAVRDKSLPAIFHAPFPESWQPGQLHPNLSWTHYRTAHASALTLNRSERREQSFLSLLPLFPHVQTQHGCLNG
jgi:hypothetical protein